MQTKTFQQIADYHLGQINQSDIFISSTRQKQRLAEQIKLKANLLKTAQGNDALAICASLAMLKTEWRDL